MKVDGRVKLTDEEREEIVILFAKGDVSQSKLARDFEVSRRTISFILDPSKREENIQRRNERGGYKQYYDKEKHRIAMAKYRAKKKAQKDV